ncbi:hypothetical protein F2Q68_00039854 [Brassica cretica]|uniref:Uncharacterized protein n=1 Tax=Brassica cretica TaxID=69181 RepID=A0A8S9MMA8_BRACR|nr:hypothetical protein F2Q68_00039854 [Brassica cretica]
MGDQDKEKNMENPDVVHKADGSNRTIDWAVGLNGWEYTKRLIWPILALFFLRFWLMIGTTSPWVGSI